MVEIVKNRNHIWKIILIVISFIVFINPVNSQIADEMFSEGNLLYEQGEYERAIDAYEIAIFYDRNLKEAWLNKGAILDILGKSQDALKAFDEATNIDPNFKEAWLVKGIILNKMEKFDKANEAFDRAIAIDPNLESVWYYKGIALYGMAEYEKSVEAFDRSISNDPHIIEAKEGRKLAISKMPSKFYDQATTLVIGFLALFLLIGVFIIVIDHVKMHIFSLNLFKRISIVVIGIFVLWYPLTFFVNFMTSIKLGLYFSFEPSKWFSFGFIWGFPVWESLSFISVFGSLFLYYAIIITMFSEEYNAKTKASIILLFIFLIPVLSSVADIGQVEVMKNAFDLNTRLYAVSGIQENYIEALYKGKVSIYELLMNTKVDPYSMQNAILEQKIEYFSRYFTEEEWSILLEHAQKK